MNADPYLVVRAAGLYLPIAIGMAVCAVRRPARAQFTGAFMAFVWNVPAIVALHVAAAAMGWWHFDATGGLLLGMPVDLWLAWALLWGPVAFIAFPTTPLIIVIAIALSLDLALMPAAFPVVRLGSNWLTGEAVGLALCLVPSQLLARWTATSQRLTARALLQVIAFSGLIGWLLPAVAINASGTTWRNPLELPPPWLSVIVQLLALPAILGLSAVQEFVTRGGGTPIPYDPPRRIVTTGPYAYVANPMQLAAVALLAGIGAVLGNWSVAAAGLMAHVYSAGIAAQTRICENDLATTGLATAPRSASGGRGFVRGIARRRRSRRCTCRKPAACAARWRAGIVNTVSAGWRSWPRKIIREAGSRASPTNRATARIARPASTRSPARSNIFMSDGRLRALRCACRSSRTSFS